MVLRMAALAVLVGCGSSEDAQSTPPPVAPVSPVAPVAHPVAAAPNASALTKPCGDACGLRERAVVEGWKVVELRWGPEATRWNEPFAERFEIHLVDPHQQWGPLLLRSRPNATYASAPRVNVSTRDVDAGHLMVVQLDTRWTDAIGGQQDTSEWVICKPVDRHCRRVQADSSYRSPEGSELVRHFDVEFENSRLVVRSPDEARCGAPPPSAVRTEDEPELLWFGNHPWIDVFGGN